MSNANAADPTPMPAAAEMLTLPLLLLCFTDCVTGDCMVEACLVGAGITKVVECPFRNEGDAVLRGQLVSWLLPKLFASLTAVSRLDRAYDAGVERLARSLD